jgi:hypothetical protein
MATHDYIISNASGAAVRADLNNALAAIATNNSSATAPTTTYAYQWWADTGSSPTVMKLRNAANSAWITLFQLDGEWSLIPFENGTAAAPSIYFKDSGTDTGIFSPGTDQVGITTGGSVRLTTSTTAFTGTLPWQGQNGTAAAPALSFSGDPNTGIYNVGADQLGISTNGTLRFDVSTTATTSTLPVVHPLGAVGTPSITFTGDLNTGIYSPAADTLAFVEGGAEAARIDSSGRLLVGTSSASTIGPSVTATAQVEGGSTTSLSIFSNANDTGGAYVVLGKSRGATVGSNTIVNSGDELGGIYFAGADGSDRGQSGASIICSVDGTPGANDMPGRLVFSTTPDGLSNPTARLIIPNGGASSFWAVNSVFNASSGSGAGLVDSVFTGWYGGTGPQAANLGTISVRIFNNGNVQNTNNSYGALSDIKLKENIIDANSQWDDIKALQVRNYNFKEGQTHTQIGLVAQEVELVSPGLVCESPDRDEDGNDLGTITKSVNYSVLYMKAVKALQEAMERIEALEAKIAALEAA